METLLETSLKSSALLLAVVSLLYVAIAELQMTERKRVMLVYIFAGVLAFAGGFRLRYICVGALVVPLLVLEFLSEDVKRQQLFVRLDYKLADFLYRMFFEYAYAYFVCAMAALFVAHRWQQAAVTHAIALSLALICMVLALAALSAQKYATKTITAIIDKFEQGVLTYQLTVDGRLQTMFAVLAGMEDWTYFERADRQHTLPFSRFIAKGFAYMRLHKARGILRALRGLFSRGYGTIEMQLLRSVGIKYGYQYTVRRKVFELLYANMLFNGYRAYLVRESGDYSQYREFIIRKYIENVDVSVNGVKFRPNERGSTLLQMFHKRNLTSITTEEFFVWCLGLPQRSYIYPATLDYYSEFMRRFGINRAEVERLLDRFSASSVVTTA